MPHSKTWNFASQYIPGKTTILLGAPHALAHLGISISLAKKITGLDPSTHSMLSMAQWQSSGEILDEGLLVYFNAPRMVSNHATKACEAGLAQRQALGQCCVLLAVFEENTVEVFKPQKWEVNESKALRRPEGFMTMNRAMTSIFWLFAWPVLLEPHPQIIISKPRHPVHLCNLTWKYE